MKHEIKNIYGAVLFTADVPEGTESGLITRVALEQAVEAGAYLAGANLAGANLGDANLGDANLARANLAGAYLARAYLAGAYLADAYLARANLAGANLAGANLGDANLARANLAGANLAGANLGDANLARANLAGAYLARAYLAGAYLARAYLAGAYLADAYLAELRGIWGTSGNLREVKAIQCDTWPVTYTATHMQIGCQLHTLEAWWSFSDEQINEMACGALLWWQKWKPVLQQIIAMSPAVPGAEKAVEQPEAA